MKVGSICECIKTTTFGFGDVPPCVAGEILIVNWVGEGTHIPVAIGFEEKPWEGCYNPKNFREIEFPPELEEQINQSLHQTVEI